MAPKPKGKKAAKIPLDFMAKMKLRQKKPPPPPKCFDEDQLERLKEIFTLYDEEEVDMVDIKLLGTMLRKLGFNPKGHEVEELLKKFLEDEFQDRIDVHDWYKIVEVKMKWGDDSEHDVTEAIKFIGHDEYQEGQVHYGEVNLEVLMNELAEWGEPLSEIELKDLPKATLKEKSLEFETNILYYHKFVDRMNSKDYRFIPEPVNFFKLDQKTLAAMARAKFAEETAEMERREAERKQKEILKIKRMIEAGLLPPETPIPE